MEEYLGLADPIRRDVLNKAVLVAPGILTLPVIPSFASAGSRPMWLKEDDKEDDEVATEDLRAASLIGRVNEIPCPGARRCMGTDTRARSGTVTGSLVP